MPIEALVEIPFVPLTEFSAHEEKFLAGMPVKISEECPQIRELLPHIARHLVEHGSFAVHHLIMRERQYKILRKSIEHAESKVIGVVFPVNRIVGKIFECIMHPTHVPFHVEAQTSEVGRLRYACPGCRFFSDSEHAGVVEVDDFVEFFYEIDRLDIFVASIFIGYPLSFLARIVQIDHGRYGIDPEAVYMIFVEPKERVRYKIVTDLVSPVIEDQRAPLLVFALPRIFMFIEAGAIKKTESVRVFREMGRHPVHDDPDSLLVALIDKMHEVFRFSESARRGIIAEGLISPRGIKWMFRHRQKFDMCEAEIFDIGNEFFGQFTVCQEPVTLPRPHPRSGVHFIDRKRGLKPVFP